MADIWMDVDTAVVVPLNILPLLDDTDFKTIETALAYNSAGLVVLWNFVTTAGVQSQVEIHPTTGGVHDLAHLGNGMYSIEIPATGGNHANNDAAGFGWITGVATGILPFRGPIVEIKAEGASADPWEVALPGSYAEGSAGYALGNVDEKVWERLMDPSWTGLEMTAEQMLKNTTLGHHNYICTKRWDGSLADVITVTGCECLAGGSLTVCSLSVNAEATEMVLGTLDVDGFHKDPGFNFQLEANGGFLYITGAFNFRPTGVLNFTVRLDSGYGEIKFQVRLVGMGCDIWPRADGGASHYSGGLMIPPPFPHRMIEDDGGLPRFTANALEEGGGGGGGADIEAIRAALAAILAGSLVPSLIQDHALSNARPEITIAQGNVKALTFALGAGYPLTGKVVHLAVKKNKSDAITAAIINDNCTITDAVNGICSYTTTSAQTATPGRYHLEVEVRNDDESAPVTAFLGYLNIVENVRK